MDIRKLKINPKKLDKLNVDQLQHCIQLVDVEIENYSKVTKNYPDERYEKFSKPYIKSWNDFRKQITDKIEDLSKTKV